MRSHNGRLGGARPATLRSVQQQRPTSAAASRARRSHPTARITCNAANRAPLEVATALAAAVAAAKAAAAAAAEGDVVQEQQAKPPKEKSQQQEQQQPKQQLKQQQQQQDQQVSSPEAAGQAASTAGPLDPLLIEPCSAEAPCRLCRIAGWRRLPIQTDYLAPGVMPWRALFGADAPLLLHSTGGDTELWPGISSTENGSSSIATENGSSIENGSSRNPTENRSSSSKTSSSSESTAAAAAAAALAAVLQTGSDAGARLLPGRATVAAGAVVSFRDTGALVTLVADAAAVPRAINWLKADAAFDGVIAVDLEWRAQFSKKQPGAGEGGSDGSSSSGSSERVALIQVATPSRCALFRVSSMGPDLPPSLLSLLSDPSLTVLVQGWEGSDEKMMRRSFGFTGKSMPHRVDLQDVGTAMGYTRVGLKAMSQAILSSFYSKSKKVTCSNWETPELSQRQIRYAALDAFNCQWMYRALYRDHLAAIASADVDSGLHLEQQTGDTQDAALAAAAAAAAAQVAGAPEQRQAARRCATCGQPFGAVTRGVEPLFSCSHPGCGVEDLRSRKYLEHCAETGHACAAVESTCDGCGRTAILRGPAAAAVFARWLPAWQERRARRLEMQALYGDRSGATTGAETTVTSSSSSSSSSSSEDE